ncbi:PREDICTED: probable leucine-rich repeat receptor-like protein kinase IMK3 isoform X3 [Lupinus angustifolius]|uniref:probable leucine-rich repeat receptor-like protein kinase IMK3 isoform X3 n=1 Tax=Lupinus angustifolius TaxID=3871 RepID=UPI00092F6D22|nr:PREDICTED: probable leucine-rich repeat receptor-like protein kinase IMK3 isoform X3 [Lupinus angustifolius]
MVSSKCFFHNNPFHVSDKKIERLKLFFCLWILMLLPTCVKPGLGENDHWDGVVVTESDFLALEAFKQELVDPKGFLRSWNDSGYGACSGGWIGIKCSMGQVIVIQLPWKGLSGQISDRIGQLQELRKLSLHDNLISGSIPSSLGLLPNLRGVQLFNNKLSGSIPPSLGYCPLLQSLDLSNNLLTGTIPDSIASSTRLYWLNLSFNSFSGSIPAKLTHSDSLTILDFQHNNLSGSVPTLLANKFNSSSFVGNIRLCGYSLSTRCPSPAPSFGVIASPPKLSQQHHHMKLSTKDIILIAAGALLIVLVTLCCVLLICLIRKRATSKAANDRVVTRTGKGVPPVVGGVGEVEEGSGEGGGKLVHFDGPMAFTADDLLCATAEIMGKSTYGTVYKATLEDGSEVAVKRLREKITKNEREFESEVCVLGKIRHPNLLALRAYYLGPKGEKLLVFDYMHKGNLASFLHVRGPETVIDWPTRMRIAQGVANGLFYLHSQENIIHGHLTSNNVLLDENTNAKIADFGLSRLMTTAANSNIIATAGALGYRAPELLKLKKATNKSDIYSLGIILLELLTGKSPNESMNDVDLAQWVASIVKEEWTNEVFDVELMRDASTIGDELLNTLKLALHCVDPSPSARPDIQQVLQQLQEIRPVLSSEDY